MIDSKQGETITFPVGLPNPTPTSIAAVNLNVIAVNNGLTQVNTDTITNATNIALKASQADLTATNDKVEALETSVGTTDTTGLRKRTADLETSVGSATSGLVKKVGDLEDYNIEVVKEVVKVVGDLEISIDMPTTGLKDVVGNATSGLVKKVGALETSVGTSDTAGLRKRTADLETSVGTSDTAGLRGVVGKDDTVAGSLRKRTKDLEIFSGISELKNVTVDAIAKTMTITNLGSLLSAGVFILNTVNYHISLQDTHAVTIRQTNSTGKILIQFDRYNKPIFTGTNEYQIDNFLSISNTGNNWFIKFTQLSLQFFLEYANIYVDSDFYSEILSSSDSGLKDLVLLFTKSNAALKRSKASQTAFDTLNDTVTDTTTGLAAKASATNLNITNNRVTALETSVRTTDASVRTTDAAILQIILAANIVANKTILQSKIDSGDIILERGVFYFRTGDTYKPNFECLGGSGNSNPVVICSAAGPYGFGIVCNTNNFILKGLDANTFGIVTYNKYIAGTGVSIKTHPKDSRYYVYLGIPYTYGLTMTWPLIVGLDYEYANTFNNVLRANLAAVFTQA